MYRFEVVGRKVLAWAVPAVAILMLAMILVPAEVWNAPKNDAVYRGFDSNLIFVDEKGDAQEAGTVKVSPESLTIKALPNSQPTVHLATTPFKSIVVTVDIRVTEAREDTTPLRIGIWSARSGSGYFIDFGPSPSHLITARGFAKGSVAPQTLVGGSIVKSETLGTYTPGQVSHLEIVLDKNSRTLTFAFPEQNKVASVTADELPDLFDSLRLSLTATASARTGAASASMENYSLTLPHQRWQVAGIDDIRGTRVVVALLVLGVVLVSVRLILFVVETIRQGGGLGLVTRISSIRNHTRTISGEAIVIGIWVAVAISSFLFLNILLFGLGNLPFDMLSQKIWVYVASTFGPSQLYYLPNVVSLAKVWGGAPFHEAVFPYNIGFAYYFTALGWIYTLFFGVMGPLSMDTSYLEFLIKIFNVLFVLADGVLIYLISRKIRVSRKLSLLAGSLFLFNPAVWFSSSIWGQTHVISLFFLLASIYAALKNWPLLAWAMFGATSLNRPQMMVPALFLGLVFLRIFCLRKNTYAVSWTVILIFLLLGPLALAVSPSLPADILVNQMLVQEAGGNEPAMTTVTLGAYSIWPLITAFTEGASGFARFFQPSASLLIGDLSYQRTSQILTLGLVLLVAGILAFHRRVFTEEGDYLPLLALGTIGFLMLLTGMAATHFIIGLPLLILCQKRLKGMGYYALVTIWSVTTLVPMYGNVGRALINVSYLAPALEPSNNAVTRFFMDLNYSDWFITLGTLANMAMLVWLAKRVLSPFFARQPVPLMRTVPGNTQLLGNNTTQRGHRYVLWAIIIAGLIGIWVYTVLSSPNILPGTDSGQWLMFSRFYLGKPIPYYIGPLTVPPVFPALLAAFTFVLGSNTAIPVLASLLFVGFCLSAFYLARELFGDEWVALIAIVLVALAQSILLDLTAFGGYLQLMAMLWMNVALLFWCRIGNGKGTIQSWWGLSISSLLVLFSHTPTAIVFLPCMALVFFYLWWRNRYSRPQFFINSLKFLTLPILAWLFYMVLFWSEHSAYAANEGGFYRRGVNVLLTYLGNNPTQLVTMVGMIGLIGLLCVAWHNKSKRLIQSASIIAIWFLTPFFVMIATYVLQIGTDYVRFLYYFIAPVMVASAFIVRILLLRTLKVLQLIYSSHKKNLSFVQAVFYLLSLSATTVLAIWGMIATVDNFPDSVRRFSVTNTNSLLESVSWLGSGQGFDSAVFAPSREARWIEGLTGRASLADTETYWLYRPGEIDRAFAADLIASSTYGIENGYLFARYQQVSNSVPINPSIAVYNKGMYVDFVIIQDRLILVDTDMRGVKRRLNLDRDFVKQCLVVESEHEPKAEIICHYTSQDSFSAVRLTKKISLAKDTSIATIDFRFISLGNTKINQINYKLADPIETSNQRAIGHANLTWVNLQFGKISLFRKEFDGSFIMGDIEFLPSPSRQMITQGTISPGEPFLESVYIFQGQNDIHINMNVTAQTYQRFRDGLRVYNVFDLIQRYNVQYLLINRADKLAQVIFDHYQLAKVYSNTNYVIYQVSPDYQ